MDFDTGGKPEHFSFAVKSMERLGISAVIIEDKTGLKKILYLEMMCHKLKIQLKTFVTKFNLEFPAEK